MRPDLAPRNPRDRIIVALDVSSPEAARDMVARLGDAITFYKVGMQLVFGGGLSLIPELTGVGKRVFLDMKLLDIDNTVSGGVGNIAQLGATFTTIHAYPQALRAAVAARGSSELGLLGVTVLTSMDDADLRAAGYRDSAERLVAARAADALAAGMDGLVCSPLEAAAVREIVGSDMVIVTPGVRPSGFALDDQSRIMNPGDAIRAGADYLVIGRPITAAGDPRYAADQVVHEVEQALEAI